MTYFQIKYRLSKMHRVKGFRSQHTIIVISSFNVFYTLVFFGKLKTKKLTNSSCLVAH